MTTSEAAFDADMIILGGGCAGLSLATRLALRCASLEVIVLEARTAYAEDRTWCGWRTSPHPYLGCVAAAWPEWRVVHGDEVIQRGSRSLPYEMIPADRFYEESLQTIRSSACACVETGSVVEAVIEDSQGVSISLGDGRTLRSQWAIDTRPQRQTLAYPGLWQNFVGYEITVDARWLDLLGTTPILMDFQPSGTSAIQFMYVLPLGDRRYLCEWTRFSATYGEAEEIERDLGAWLQQRGCTADMIGRRESGSLPMSVALPPTPGGSRVVRAGTLGGSMRASTGYAFHAIQRWADACTDSLATGGPPLPPARNARLDFLDEVFLTAIQDHRAAGESIFLDLFKKTEPDRLIRFLSGIPRTSDILPVMASLPWLQFSKAAVKTIQRRVVGR